MYSSIDKYKTIEIRSLKPARETLTTKILTGAAFLASLVLTFLFYFL